MRVDPPDIDDDLEEGNLGRLAQLRVAEEVHIESQQVNDLDARNSEIKGSQLVSITAHKGHFEGSILRDVVIDTSDLSVAKLSDAHLTRVLFSGSRLEGADFAQGHLQDVTFLNCNLTMANFAMATLHSVRFEGCVMGEADFLQTKMKDVEFVNCELNDANFAEGAFENVDLRSSVVAGLKGAEQLKGVTIDESQLPAIAAQLAVSAGIIIK